MLLSQTRPLQRSHSGVSRRQAQGFAPATQGRRMRAEPGEQDRKEQPHHQADHQTMARRVRRSPVSGPEGAELTADETPPPMAPALIIPISMIGAGPGRRPARFSGPRRPI